MAEGYVGASVGQTDVKMSGFDNGTSAPPTITPSDIMRRIKGKSSTKLFQEYPLLKKRYWGQHFWARGYFCITAGELTKEMIIEYLEHHFERKPNDNFDVE